MRFFLLLSALLTAFAAGLSPARAAGVAAAQVSALVEHNVARAVVSTVNQRPQPKMPRVSDVLCLDPLVATPVGHAVPRYAGRLRT
ncbi:MAG: hypothetical protein ACKVOP_08570 [Sphingomonadaceae bacterium]